MKKYNTAHIYVLQEPQYGYIYVFAYRELTWYGGMSPIAQWRYVHSIGYKVIQIWK